MNLPYLGLGGIKLALPVIFLACTVLNFRSVRRYDRQGNRAGAEVYAANILASVAVAGTFMQLGGRPDPLALILPGAYLAANLTHAILTRRY